MNYGKFFRLNQNLSRIEEGFAIYDYIDLPAYFAPSMSNRMSPKYPISVLITPNSVIFRLHYSALKIENSQVGSDKNYPKYCYNKEAVVEAKPGDKTEIVHMAEVILELPYADSINRSLSDAIKSIYHTNFPQILKVNGEENQINKTHENSSGGRFLERLIRKRYPEVGKQIETTDVDAIFYEALRKVSDETTSYSTLWLMGLVPGEKHERYYRRTNNEGKIIGFLRKLLLDFMFDLKHSDVFQNSACYHTMYSGLMSDFYFSALMHKCEYYYYRELITDEISKIEKEEKQGNKKTKKKKHEDNLKRLRDLYAQELFKAEELWINDIMSPSSEVHFEHYNIKDKKNDIITFRARLSNWLRNGKELVVKAIKQRDFDVWDSWFASPEEEMRRVCFAKKDDQDIVHLCNAETLAEYLELSKHNSEAVSKQMIRDKDYSKVAISQWFLKRYDFRDVMRLHLFKRANILLFSILFLLIGLVFLFPEAVSREFWEKALPTVLWLSLSIIFFWIVINYKSCLTLSRNDLIGTKNRYIIRRILGIAVCIFWALMVLFVIPYLISYSSFQIVMNEENTEGTIYNFTFILSQVICILGGGMLINKFFRIRLLANMHVLYPRLIASIAAAWLSLAIGNELFGTFFDSIVSWSTSIWLTVIVFVFVMYEINKFLPFEKVWIKVSRGLGIISISYLISFIIGLSVINFTGERFLERSGVLEEFYKEHVENNNSKQVDRKKYLFRNESSLSIDGSNDSTIQVGVVLQNLSIDSLGFIRTTDSKLVANITMLQGHDYLPSNAEMLKELENIHIVPNKKTTSKHPIVTKWDLPGGAKFFILRDFLIQFAFVAMFIGIFIQMLFEEKSITEV